ncbi:MAG: MMPL family transporter [Bacteroidales bacterium]|nr:MMPL family transporter [Bacteroidales bacterium]
MQRFFLTVFDWVQQHRRWGGIILTLLVALCVLQVSRLQFKEEITDFLPVDEHYRESMRIYQEVASADKLILQFTSTQGKDSIIAAVERFGELLAERDSIGWIASYEPQVDYSRILDVTEFVYSHLPYYLDESDYLRMDSLWKDSVYIGQRFDWIQTQLGSLSGSFIMPVLQLDPLGMGNRIGERLRGFQPEMQFDRYDGYVFTSDGKSCLVTVESPFGSSETDYNGRLIQMLEQIGSELGDDIELHLMGAPVIAVSNASRIRQDIWIALSVSVILILVLLWVSFRSLLSLWYIALSTAFGFLLAVAGLSLSGQQVSLIVIGIASVIIGIAVNYPLHFVCHSQDVSSSENTTASDGRRVLSDLVKPLLIGNITTVAAFLTLVPLEAVAIRQLGLFSALMLVGTILFVLLVLPHFGMKRFGRRLAPEQNDKPAATWMDRFVKHPLVLSAILILTLVLGWQSLGMTFDSDVSHLNYMTAGQRADMKRLEAMQGPTQGVVVYVTATAGQMEAVRPLSDSLLSAGLVTDEKNPSFFLPSESLQQHRLQLWEDFWQTHNYLAFLSESRSRGFSEEAFEPFQLLIEEEHPVLSSADFYPLTSSLLTGYVGQTSLVARLSVPDEESASVTEELLNARLNGGRAFDLPSLNRRIANTLTADFNYIGFACAIIVFLFLWISFGRVELALLAFAPMVVGWIWILGLMQLFGIQFNLVNIILATFIFGQGDDYTIFITEGLVKDYRQGSGHRVLVGYQRSILLSAAIMLVGIGSLILARHPAMHSLAEVTIIGMTVVVLMAWLVPPVLFHWLLRVDKPLREYLNKTEISE